MTGGFYSALYLIYRFRCFNAMFPEVQLCNKSCNCCDYRAACFVAEFERMWMAGCSIHTCLSVSWPFSGNLTLFSCPESWCEIFVWCDTYCDVSLSSTCCLQYSWLLRKLCHSIYVSFFEWPNVWEYQGIRQLSGGVWENCRKSSKKTWKNLPGAVLSLVSFCCKDFFLLDHCECFVHYLLKSWACAPVVHLRVFG